MDEYPKIKIISLAVLIGSTSFLFRLIGVLFCDLKHVHTPLDINLLWCFILSLLLWLMALIVIDDDI